MAFLLHPEDERRFIGDLLDRGQLSLLADDLFGAESSPATIPVDLLDSSLPRSLPEPVQPLQESLVPATFFLWASEIGPLRRASEAPPSMDVRDRVADSLRADSTARPGALLDHRLSPILRFSRAHWHDSGALHPGLWQGPALQVREWAPELADLYREVERMLKGEGVKLDPFEHAPRELPVDPPETARARSRFAVWVWPSALQWVESGGKIWPWTA